MKTNLFHKVLFLQLFLLLGYKAVQGQMDLVRWNNTNYTPTIVGSNITASNLTYASGVNGGNQTWDVGFFETGTGGTWPSGAIDLSKYIEFTISANSGYQINLANFNFYHRVGWNSPNFQVRYSKDNFATFHTAIGNTTSSGSWTAATGSLSSVNPVLPGQTVKIRVYVYNTSGATFHIRRTDSSFSPIITGTVSAADPPVSVNDDASTGQDIPVDIDILNNDTYSTLSAITITQQPTNGQNITVNSLTDVTYTPNNGYTGTDSFKYTITDGNGTSNEATVNITVVTPVAPTAVGDAVSVTANQTTNINILSNDTPGSAAFDYVTIVAGPPNGTVIVNPNNTVAYTPNINYTGADSFQYTVTNMHNTTSNTVTVTLNVYSPVGLVRWNGGGYNPNILVSNISASDITNHGGGTLISNNWGGNENFQTGSWPNPSQNGGYLNEARYVQFTITPDANYQIHLNQFNFEVQMDGGSANFEVRYSKDFSQGYSSFNGTISGSWAAKSGSLLDLNPILPGETVYIRLYVYNTYNALRIRHSWGGSTGPTITGAVSSAVTADPTDLKVTKTMDNTTPQPGNNVTYTITVENLGPNTASAASVIDQLPPGFSYVSSTVSVGAYNPATGIWTIGNLLNSATATLQITAQMQAGGPHTNTATVSHGGSDPVSANNTASVTPTNVCANCTHTVSGGAITVNSGETYCLHSGSWSGGVTLNGGTICIAQGATFTASYTTGLASGRIINRGTVTAFPLSSDNNHTVYIENRGAFTSAYLQNFSGTIENHSIMNINGALDMRSGSVIENYAQLTVNNIHCNGTIVHNYNTANLTVTNGVNVYSGYWNNHLGGEVYLNGSNVNFTGDLDNSGYWEFERISSLSSTLNNYGKMKVYNTASNISSTTYLTNDDLLEFINVAEIQYNGPMLTNNGTITVTHGTTGNFKMNQAINQVFNNGSIVVSGQFEQNAAGSLLVNSCKVVARNVFIGNGEARNNGLIWATGTGVNEGLQVQGLASIVKNGPTGHIRGVNFTNSGQISGFGGFYFTGTTNMNSAGSFIGDEPNSILFFDASQTGDNIFDSPGGTVSNVMRPDTMTPLDSSSYNCEAPPSVAGYPPTTTPFSVTLCDPSIQTFSLNAPNVLPHEDVEGQAFTVLYNTVRLFNKNNAGNPTNNTDNLVIPDTGVFAYNESTKLITFTPHPAFTSGTVEAEYRISNSRTGDPIVYPSGRTGMTITLTPLILQPITVASGTEPLCIGQTLTLANIEPDGVWSSSVTGVGTVDAETGVVTGVATGITTITYTVNNGICEKYVTKEVTVQSCTTIPRKVITNPMLPSKAKRP